MSDFWQYEDKSHKVQQRGQGHLSSFLIPPPSHGLKRLRDNFAQAVVGGVLGDDAMTETVRVMLVQELVEELA